MDIVVTWPGSHLPPRLIDVTVRDPAACRYQPRAAAHPGAAADRAAEEKEQRYPAHNGARVEVLAMEPLGRLGEAGVRLLEELAADAATAAADRAAGPSLRRRWRHALEVTLTRGVADAMLPALGRVGAVARERGAAPRLGRVADKSGRAAHATGPPPAAAGQAADSARPTGGALRPEQLQRAAANRLRALEKRAANLEREGREAEARAAEAAAEADAREEDRAARGLGVT